VNKAACEGKHKYKTKKQASAVISRTKQKSKGGYALNAYKCGECGKWHIGNITSKGVLMKKPSFEQIEKSLKRLTELCEYADRMLEEVKNGSL